ncbi:MAG: AMMECR1 domain-containing protein [Nitrospira bacterium HGW-Nitrospira-1]|nr:MAG: AMMECR1 domain-containing protein [Nitrospira bacterium HGW-Nitrospira-1]
MHKLVELAKKTVEEFIRTGKEIPPPKEFVPEMTAKAGVFVSLKKKGNLRGCIGTFMPYTENVACEIIKNAISAATHDSRFDPVGEDELNDLAYSVDVLSPPEKVSDISELDPKKYGVIVVHGSRKGLLLPDLEGVDSVEEQLRIAKMKAWINPDEKVEIFRFMVSRYR